MVLPTQNHMASHEVIKKSTYRQILFLRKQYEDYLVEIDKDFSYNVRLIINEFEQAFIRYTKHGPSHHEKLIEHRFRHGILRAISDSASRLRLIGALHFQVQELIKEETHCGIVIAKRLSTQLVGINHAVYLAISDVPIITRWKLHDEVVARWQTLRCAFDSKRQALIEDLCLSIRTAPMRNDVIGTIKSSINTLQQMLSQQGIIRIFNSDNKRLADMLRTLLSEQETADDPMEQHTITHEQAQNILLLIKQRILFLQQDFKKQSALFHEQLQQHFRQKPFVLIEFTLKKMQLITNDNLLAALKSSWLSVQKTLPEEEQYHLDTLKSHYNQYLMNLFFMINLAASPSDGLVQQRDNFRLASTFSRQLQGMWDHHLLPSQRAEMQRLSIFKIVQIGLDQYWDSALIPISIARLLKSTQLLTYFSGKNIHLDSAKKQLFYTLFDTTDAQAQESFSSKTILFKRKSRLGKTLYQIIKQLEVENLSLESPLIETFVREQMENYWASCWFFEESERQYIAQLLQGIREIEQMNDANCLQLHDKLIAYQQGFYGALSKSESELALQWLADYKSARQKVLLAEGHVYLMKKQLIAALFSASLKQLQSIKSKQGLYRHLQGIQSKLIDSGRLEASYTKEVLPKLVSAINQIIADHHVKKPKFEVAKLQLWLFNDFCQEDMKLLYQLQQELVSAQTAGEASSLLDAVIGRLANSSKPLAQQISLQLQELLTSFQSQQLLPVAQPTIGQGSELQKIALSRRNYEAALSSLIPKIAGLKK